MSTDLQELRQEVRWLGSILGQVIASLEGEEALALEERVRQLAKARRQGDPQASLQLTELLEGLNLDECWMICRAFTLFFDLANLAEDRQRVRTLKRRQQSQRVRGESLAAAVQSFALRGLSPEELQTRLSRLCLQPVFTAHPTEAKRRAVRGHLQRLRRWLKRSDQGAQVENSVREIIETLWHTDLLRPRRPTVLEEVERGLATVRKLWNVVPRLHRELKEALAEHYPQSCFELPPFLQFGTWMGGDRDGNPYVTSDITAQTLRHYRTAALKLHLRQASRCFSRLTQSEVRIQASPELKVRVQEALWQWPALTRLLEPFSATEVPRRWLRIVRWRLNQSLKQVRQGGAGRSGIPGAYRDGQELHQDLLLLSRSLKPFHCRRLEGWCVQTATFGFFLARLDIRQESKLYHQMVSELLQNPGYLTMSEEDRLAVLDSSSHLAATSLSPAVQEAHSLFRLLSWYRESYGCEQLGCHILSMTHEASDILALLWLQNKLAPGLHMPLVPLFETIRDLQKGPEILESLLAHPSYREYLREHCQDLQVVMVGYSDSTKDGGYLAANWWLYRSQQRMQATASQFGVELRFFHGRGGSLGRGGGPAARSILSLPRETTTRGLRLTEQGEVLAERYDDPPIAHRHLEQLLWSLLEVNAAPAEEVPASWIESLDRLAQASLQRYRSLVDHPGFLEFFRLATPIQGIEKLAIGSRPARRSNQQHTGLQDLRAIPWVFSWTQNRVLLPAWYGLGSAFEAEADLPALKQLYDQWPFFQAVMANAELALAKADMGIARAYAGLLPETSAAQAVFQELEAEFERSRKIVLALTGRQQLLEAQPWLERSIRVRNPYVDPLNLIQVETFRRLRQQEDAEAQEVVPFWNLLRMTIQGVAAGLRTTG